MDTDNVTINKEKLQIEEQESIRPIGFIVCAASAVACIAMSMSIIENTSSWGKTGFSWGVMTSDIGCIMMASYFILSCSLPSYLMGDPALVKLSPLVLGGILTFMAGILQLFENLAKSTTSIYFWLEFLSPLAFFSLGFFAHMTDDESGECAKLMFKPWKKAESCDSCSV